MYLLKIKIGLITKETCSFEQRTKRERMPPSDKWRCGGIKGQIVCYPRKQWKKRTYQYLKFFMQPRGNRLGPTSGLYEDAEMCTISQIENPSLAPVGSGVGGPGGVGVGGVAGPDGEASMGSKEDSKQVRNIFFFLKTCSKFGFISY